MKNWKVGMRVYHYLNMHKPGEIVELKRVKNNTWLTEGTSQERLSAKICHDDGQFSNFWANARPD